MSMVKSKCRQSETGAAWEPVLEPGFHPIKRGRTDGAVGVRATCYAFQRDACLYFAPHHWPAGTTPHYTPPSQPHTHTPLPACRQPFVSGRRGEKNGRKSDPHGGAIKPTGDWQSSLKPGQVSITPVTLQRLTSPASSLSPQQHQRLRGTPSKPAEKVSSLLATIVPSFT